MSTLMRFEQKNESLVQERYLQLEIMEKIFEIMERKGITQTDLAKKMNLSKSQISRLLADDRNLTLSSVSRIFSALGEKLAILTKSEETSLYNQGQQTETVIHLNVSYAQMPSAAGKVTIPTTKQQGYNYGNMK